MDQSVKKVSVMLINKVLKISRAMHYFILFMMLELVLLGISFRMS